MAPENIKITNLSNNLCISRIIPCRSFLQNFFGLMFRPSISKEEGILLIGSRDSRMEAAIHMFFMQFPIAVIWLNNKYQVVDKTVAQPWHPFYVPKSPAKYVIEIHPSHINDFQIGDYVSYA